jgi:hypothetical protein
METEGCAVPLARWWDHAGQPLHPEVRERLLAAASLELKRILAARAQLPTLSRLARETGCRPILVKGGAFLSVEARSYYLDDLDILLPRSEARTYAAALDAAGYQTLAGSSSYRHLSGRAAPGSIEIEIHVLGNRDRDWLDAAAQEAVLPIPGYPELTRLAPLAHVWDILVHVTVGHTHRRGRIRDVLLLADAIADCSPDDRVTLARRMTTHPSGRAMDAQLTMARAIGDKTPTVDAFEGVALTNYVLRGRTRGVVNLPGHVQEIAPNLAFAILGGPIERRYFWAQQIAIPLEPSGYSFIAWVQRRHAGLGGLWLLLLRVLRLPFALALAFPLVVAARRALRQAGLEPRIG